MSEFSAPETLHRLVKEAIDSGNARTIEEAEAMFKSFRLGFEIGDTEASDARHQAALLTGVALASRVFLGGVFVAGPASQPLMIPLPIGATLGAAVENLGGTMSSVARDLPLVTIGGLPKKRSSAFNIRTEFAGWRAGIVPAHSEITLSGTDALPISPMLSAALAVNAAFSVVRSGNVAAGQWPSGLSLWNPSRQVDWTKRLEDEPHLSYLPSQLWLIGLGHLGQAFLWALGLLEYPAEKGLSLVLHDFDLVTPASVSTSILTEAADIGRKKTRTMSAWAERRGFSTTIIERPFRADFRRHPEEPAIAFCGVDNGAARQALDSVGFDLVVEAGLGRGHRNFRSIRLHTLPGPIPAASIWSAAGEQEEIEDRPAYKKLLEDNVLDQCGVTLLAGKAVGAPFVGSVAACLGLAEILRLLHGGRLHQLIEMDLRGVEHRSAVTHPKDFGNFNPGFIHASHENMS